MANLTFAFANRCQDKKQQELAQSFSWQTKLSRVLEDKKVAFKVIKPRFLFSREPNVIKKKITNSPNVKLELCSKAQLQLLSTFEDQFLGLQISRDLGPPVTCSGGAFALVH